MAERTEEDIPIEEISGSSQDSGAIGNGEVTKGGPSEGLQSEINGRDLLEEIQFSSPVPLREYEENGDCSSVGSNSLESYEQQLTVIDGPIRRAVDDIRLSGEGISPTSRLPQRSNSLPLSSKYSAKPPKAVGRRRSLVPLSMRKAKSDKPKVMSEHKMLSKTISQQYQSRPECLPPKSKKEEKKHKKEIHKLLKKVERETKKAEKKEIAHEKKKRERDDRVSDHVQEWKEEILPKWETKHSNKEVRKLWEKGLPPSVRGDVWIRAIGNYLGITKEMYDDCLSKCRAKLKEINQEESESYSIPSTSDKASSVQVIHLDVMRTFPTLGFFQKGCVMHNMLHDVLGAYAYYRPDVGYVQGMSFLAAVLLLNMDAFNAFVCLGNLLSKPCYSVFFRVDNDLMQPYFDAFDYFLKAELPVIHQHFQNLAMLPHYYLMEWIITLYTKCLPLDVSCRVWDLFCRDGESFLFRTALGILKMHKSDILEADVLEDCGRVLSKFSEAISSDKLFKHIMSINLTEKGFQLQLSLVQNQTLSQKMHSP